jgi:predicted HTH domain antitoxin
MCLPRLRAHTRVRPYAQQQFCNTTDEWGDLPRRTLAALAIAGYRAGRLSLGQVAKMLGIGVIEADAFLKERGVDLDYSLADLEQDRRTLKELFGK